MINNKQAVQNLARKLVEANPSNLNEPDNYVAHTGQVYDLAYGVVGNILAKYHSIPLNREEVSLASGLHDIGRPLQSDQIFHELRGAEYIEIEGLESTGFSASLRDRYRIAQMFRSHGCVYEFWQASECAEKRKEFEPLEDCLLIPRSWQEAIVTYSDLASHNGERIKVEDRMSELLNRYENDARYKDGIVVRVARAGLNRILELAERVEALEQGRLTEQDVARYGFL